ncbi:MFS transporter [Arthrobacter sp. I2-34]|uniref:MFS transporter n=1 Tax=Arthrobacter hankyongi TaxID=2904801 RepID=A0ABS9L356_9MICC|nr:MFS transporter [Arthrobacter hankyongi]MCG2621120.1 MFS transporter [Arthrobacter hankyongi]
MFLLHLDIVLHPSTGAGSLTLFITVGGRMSSPAANPLLKLGPIVYGPSLLFSLGEGLLIPLLPLLAIERGANLSVAGLLAAAVMLGQFLGNIPAGALVARCPEKWAMTIAGALTVVCGVCIALASFSSVLAMTAFAVGALSATYGLARQAFLTLHVPYSFRGRALALLGGTHRAGIFTGPLAAWAVLQLTSEASSAVWVFVGCALLTTVFVAVAPEPQDRMAARALESTPHATAGAPQGGGSAASPTGGAPPEGLFTTAIAHRGPLLRLGIPSALLALVRSGRQVLLPLWGTAIGLGPDTILAVIALSGLIDLILFYPGGQIMDRLGRMWGVLPAALTMSVGLLCLAVTQPGVEWYVAVAVILGAGNGLSSGALLTLASDLAPSSNPSPFIGIWRTLTQGGSALAPLLVATVTVWLPLGAAAATLSTLGFVGVAGFVRWMPVYLDGTRRRGPRVFH